MTPSVGDAVRRAPVRVTRPGHPTITAHLTAWPARDARDRRVKVVTATGAWLTVAPDQVQVIS